MVGSRSRSVLTPLSTALALCLAGVAWRLGQHRAEPDRRHESHAGQRCQTTRCWSHYSGQAAILWYCDAIIGLAAAVHELSDLILQDKLP